MYSAKTNDFNITICDKKVRVFGLSCPKTPYREMEPAHQQYRDDCCGTDSKGGTALCVRRIEPIDIFDDDTLRSITSIAAAV